MTDNKLTTFNPTTNYLENLNTNIASIDTSTGTLKVNNLDLNLGSIHNLGSFNGPIISNSHSIKIASSNNIGFDSGILFQDGNLVNNLNDTLTFSFSSSASYGTYDLTIPDNLKNNINTYYFSNLNNNSQFLISITPFNGTSFTLNKNSATFYDGIQQFDYTEVNSKVFFGFSEQSYTIENGETALLSISKINNNIYINIQSYYPK
jgi:hypothetical protein